MSIHFSSLRLNWKTPKAVYQILDAEFRFDFDPCPVKPTFDGLSIEWGGQIMLILRMAESFRSGLKKVLKNIRKARRLFFLCQAEQIRIGGINTV